MSLQIPVGARDEEREELLQRGDGGAGDSSNFAMAAEAGTNMSSGESMSFSKKWNFLRLITTFKVFEGPVFTEMIENK